MPWPYFHSNVLCRRNLREPDVFQVVLRDAMRPRMIFLAHYHNLAGHPGKTRMFGLLPYTYYCPKVEADKEVDTLTTVQECATCALKSLASDQTGAISTPIPSNLTARYDGHRHSRTSPEKQAREPRHPFHYGPLHEAYEGNTIALDTEL